MSGNVGEQNAKLAKQVWNDSQKFLMSLCQGDQTFFFVTNTSKCQQNWIETFQNDTRQNNTYQNDAQKNVTQQNGTLVWHSEEYHESSGTQQNNTEEIDNQKNNEQHSLSMEGMFRLV